MGSVVINNGMVGGYIHILQHVPPHWHARLIGGFLRGSGNLLWGDGMLPFPVLLSHSWENAVFGDLEYHQGWNVRVDEIAANQTMTSPLHEDSPLMGTPDSKAKLPSYTL